MSTDLTTKTDLVGMRRYADMVASLQPSAAAFLRDAATEIERQAELLDRCETLVRRVEHRQEGVRVTCPTCPAVARAVQGYAEFVHHSGCEIAALLKDLETP